MNVTYLTEDEAQRASSAQDVAIFVRPRATTALRRKAEPVTFGVPLPRGFAREHETFGLCDGEGHDAPVDTRVLETWPDGSIRWMLVDAQVSSDDTRETRYVLRPGRTSTRGSLTARAEGDRVSVETGRAEFVLRAGTSFPFERIIVDGVSSIDCAASAIAAIDQEGAPATVKFDRVTVEETNTLRAVVRAEGAIQMADRALELLLRVHFFAGSPTVRLLVRVRNPRRAEHADGFWDLGDSGSVLLKDLSLALALGSDPGQITFSRSLDSNSPLSEGRLPFALHQDSSGGENWQSPNHVNRHHVVPHTLRGYRVHEGHDERTELRASPIVVLCAARGSIAVTVPAFWQNFPKGIEAGDAGITIRLFPGDYADLYEIQGGEQKTHEIFAAFGEDRVTAEPLAWARSRVVAHADPAVVCRSGAVAHLTPGDSQSGLPLVRLINAAVDGPSTFEQKREVVDQYGWRHFGDVYGDHEAVRRDTPHPLVSHYNNQYDAVLGFACAFLRTGDTRWWTQLEELTSHVIDIDIYHTTGDKSAYNRGLFWHTYHYGDADTATHRTYPRASLGRTLGGGPSSEHNYTSGLMLHYYLTGDPESRTTAIDLGQFVVDMDDGSKTVFRWLDRGATGLASASGTFAYHGPGRGSGNSLNALVDAYRLSGDRAFLAKGEELIRRCIHPHDDVPARDLLDAERKWFYTMFLQSLGKYLDDKIDRGELDEMYAYARASLLHYARWMAVNEYPQLHRPERLEFPTETWAAQDIRKSDVFFYAAKHAVGEERARFVERGEYLLRLFDFDAADAAHAYAGSSGDRATDQRLAEAMVAFAAEDSADT